jgi:hypothetical protein
VAERGVMRWWRHRRVDGYHRRWRPRVRVPGLSRVLRSSNIKDSEGEVGGLDLGGRRCGRGTVGATGARRLVGGARGAEPEEEKKTQGGSDEGSEAKETKTAVAQGRRATWHAEAPMARLPINAWVSPTSNLTGY